jgi:hypothetical protein
MADYLVIAKYLTNAWGEIISARLNPVGVSSAAYSIVQQ